MPYYDIMMVFLSSLLEKALLTFEHRQASLHFSPSPMRYHAISLSLYVTKCVYRSVRDMVLLLIQIVGRSKTLQLQAFLNNKGLSGSYPLHSPMVLRAGGVIL